MRNEFKCEIKINDKEVKSKFIKAYTIFSFVIGAVTPIALIITLILYFIILWGIDMKIKCLGSGSIGNCYLLYCNDEVLILDAGLPIMQIKKGLDWKLGGIQGVLVTHAHT